MKKFLSFIIIIIFTGLSYGQNTDDFIWTWNTEITGTGTSNNSSVILPLSNFIDYDFTVEWGDGNIESFVGNSTTLNVSHDYGTPGIYDIIIYGIYPQFVSSNSQDVIKLIDVKQWGNNVWQSMNSAFRFSENLQITASDMPILATDCSFSQMFRGCTNFNSDIGFWVTDNVTDMSFMFFNAFSFDVDISGWNVSNVTSLQGMFNGAISFNQNISNWEVGNVTSMQKMFIGANSFNQALTDWDVSKVKDMSDMFGFAVVFNSDLSGWVTDSLTSTAAMFVGASSFNQDISGWDVSGVTNMRFMFSGSNNFDQDISLWDVSNVIEMQHMFTNASVFNQDLSGWDVGSVTNMRNMFNNAESFNQDISSWDISNVSNVSSMFENTDLFDQNIGDWNISQVTDMTGMFQNSGLMSENYDSTLIGWFNNPDGFNSNLTLDASSSYCNSQSVREEFINLFGWTINDAGLDPNCTIISGCTDISACNYNDLATSDDGSCLIPTGCDECDGAGGITDNPDEGETCDDGDSNTINDVIQNDCSCAGVIACYDQDKASLQEVFNAFANTTSLTNWDFTPGIPLDDTWSGITMTADGCNVQAIDFSGQLGGIYSPAIGNFSELIYLTSYYNGIGGEIPSTMGNLTKLVQLELVGNELTGGFPESLWDLPLLEFIDVGQNNMSGLLPVNATNSPSLNEFVLSDNNFSGCIPDSYQYFCNEYCEIYNNDLLVNDFDEYCLTGVGGCSDFDGDGVTNDIDNCIDLANVDQADLDNDGEGDACDSDIDGDNDANDVDCDPTNGTIFFGATCDDEDATTGNDIIQSDCTCSGTFIDADGDGITDAEDNCTSVANADQSDLDMDGIGDVCDTDIDDDGDENDVDCDPIDGSVFFNASCDDGDANTENDMIQADCSCAGTSIFDCPAQMADVGDVCDDGDALTIDDVILSDCSCAGTIINNVTCEEALTITDGVYLDVAFLGGTGAANSCAGTDATSALWYEYVAPLTGLATVSSVIDTDNSDTRISIYTGLCSALNCEASNDDTDFANNILTSSVTFDIIEGETYYFEWDDRWSNDNFDFEVSSSLIYDCQELQADFGDVCNDGITSTLNDEITVDCICAGVSVNATCDQAIDINEGIVLEAVISGGNGASNQCETGGTHAAWYRYTATSSGTCTISSGIDPDGPDTRLSMFGGDCTSLTCIDSNDDIDLNAGNFSSELSFPVTSGDSFYIEWDDRWDSGSFDFEISVTPFDCPLLSGDFGDACNDGDNTTINDVILTDCSCQGEYSCVIADRITLEKLYLAWDGDNSSLNWDFFNANPVNDSWTGITVTNQGCVKKIVLKSKGLNGYIHPDIEDLLSLRTFNVIRHPDLTGVIPSTIGNLPELKVLNLRQNNLSGALTSNLANFSNTATVFNIKNNNVTGCIPGSFDAFCGIIDVQLGGNPNWNNSSFQNFCNNGTGGCIESLIDGDDVVNENNALNAKAAASNALQVQIYPNPNEGNLLGISIFSEEKGGEATCNIYDLFGSLVHQSVFDKSDKNSNHEMVLNTKLTAGIYLVQITINGQRTTQKLIVQ